jgi:phytoene dehydrogenase-like protein
MTLPVELLQRRRALERYDAVIVGAGMPGLVCACMLAGAGLRVVVVDRRKRPGGHLQTLSHQGYAIDVGPSLWESPSLEQTLEAAGVKEHGLTEVPAGGVQVAVVGERGIESGPRTPPVPGTVPSPSMLDAVRELLGVPPRVFAALGGVYEELGAASAYQLEEWRRIELDAWLAVRSIEPAVKLALHRSIALLGAEEPARASVGALASRARADRSRSGWSLAGDNPIAGARGVVQALVDRLIDAGGELRLGTRATGMAVDARRFAGLTVQREEQPFADEILADRCILALTTPSLSAVLPDEPLRALAATLPADTALLGSAWALEGDGVFADAEQAWVVRGLPPAGADPANLPLPSPVTFVRASAAAPRLAPPGKGLVLAWTAVPSRVVRDARLVSSRLGHLRAALEGLLGGTDASAIEWHRSWTVPWSRRDGFAPTSGTGWVPGFEQIYVVNEEVDVPGRGSGGVVAAASAARWIAERILSGA